MRKGEKTRQHIIEKSAELFNQKGYAGSSIQDIIQVTGLTKGGVYRTFSGKDEIALEAFDYASRVMTEHFLKAAEKAETAIDKIMKVCAVYEDPVNHPPIEGGCPLLNTAVEADDGYLLLREKAEAAHGQFTSFIQSILDEGISTGELSTGLNTEAIASFVVSSLEGGVMASRLTRNNKHIIFVIQQIKLVLSSHTEKEGTTSSLNK
ncbi:MULTISPECIES: TetR/AcrR family transcriptional regulator [unclassified Bacillus (in: firmicutes)]|uniref:TetR/AcrR family transcriptional regulator n=1 Tax=unclassified Bacillus (in: firmicutes) TaxID=185979 RepID=UPI001BE901D0|nr:MULTISPECIES: TetR/AcrR family transcriptional regulator [unclassified Bacillus (in: firmicutes)]MBT2617249.1 TetR/AcrR family transcriptional regulator [Bacillus sp. ISL-78]MBT2627816.1 TetR/AcrR family transcriptional regulator [Bacillus sp. ISL-101]